jgi:hypothetical protein
MHCPGDVEHPNRMEAQMRFSPLIVAAVVVFTAGISSAASPCPSEVKQARQLLTAKSKTATAPKAANQPKALAGTRGEQDIQAPRGQQDIQAPRGQDAQATRTKDHPEPPTGPQAPRNVATGRANALANGRRLVNEAETACKDADPQRALANAHAAMELLKYVP